MKSIKRALAIVIALSILMALAMPAFAADGKSYRRYKTYTCIGDGIAAGCGLSFDGTDPVFDQTVQSAEEAYAIWEGLYAGTDWEEVPYAYHSLVSDALGCDLLQCARSGLRAVEYRYLLGGGYNDYDTDHSWGETYFDVDGDGFTLSDLDAVGKSIDLKSAIKSADLLTVNLGLNDVFSYSIAPILTDLLGAGATTLIERAGSFFEKTGDLGGTFEMLIGSLGSGKSISATKVINAIRNAFDNSLSQFKNNYDYVINKIYQINPKINVVAVGGYNPLANCALRDGSRINVRLLMTPVLYSLNSFLMSYESKFSNYYFADVTDAETYEMSLNDEYFWEYAAVRINPTRAGHATMAEQILAALPAGPSVAPKVTAGNDASTGMIKLSWDKVANADSYNIYRATSKNGTYKLVATSLIPSYIDTQTKAGVRRYYKVAAVSGNVECTVSSVVYRVADCAAPVVKGGNVSSTGYVKLTWNSVVGAEKYVVYRATSKNGTYKKMYTTTGTSYTNTNAKAGTTYYYKVKALCAATSAGDSAYSSVVTRTCDLAKPTAKITTSSGHPKLTWSKVTGATKYEVYRATSKSGTYTKMTTTNKTSYTNTSAKAGTTYYYKVRAICNNSAAASAYSSVKSIKAK